MVASSENAPTLVDHDGFVEAFYHLLWAKNFSGEPCDVLVPDVVIYKYRIPAYWYFTGSDGRLRKKNKANIVNQRIFKEFTAGVRSDKDVVACHICEHSLDADDEESDGPPKRTETIIRYFDRAGLRDFLFNQDKLDDGTLQKFVRPKGLFNSMIQAAWSPQMCLLERRVNLCPLLSGRAPLQERTATYEGSEHLSRITPVRGTLLADRIQQLCTDMVAHIAATSPQRQRISRMLVNFKTDEHDRLWFVWCSSVRVAPAELAPSSSTMPPASPATSTLRGSQSHGGFRLASSATDPSMAPVCLNPALRSPLGPPVSKHAKAPESVCPFTGKPLEASSPYFVTYKVLLDYSMIADRKQRIRRPPNEVPPLLARACPELDGESYAKERANPLSLFPNTRVLCSEEAYLDFSTTSLPGVQVLPAISAKARNRMLSASAPVLPHLPQSASTATILPPTTLRKNSGTALPATPQGSRGHTPLPLG